MKNKLTSISSKGFTLVELLVVIGIIGLLAAVLMATIDPIEQFKKTQDSNSKSMAIDYANAVVRYYSTRSVMPWSTGGNTACSSAYPSGPTGIDATTLSSNCTAALIADGELKGSYTGATSTVKTLIVTGSASEITVCFQPASKSQKADSNTKWDYTGGTSVTTYWCAK